MGEQWINPIGHNEKLSETLIQTLIETKLLKKSVYMKKH